MENYFSMNNPIFELIKQHYLLFCTIKNYSHYRALDARIIVEKSVDFLFDEYLLINNLKRPKKKLSFAEKVNKIKSIQGYSTFLRHLYKISSRDAVHGGINKISPKTLSIFFFQINSFLEWFLKRYKQDYSFLKDESELNDKGSEGLLILSDKEIKKRKEDEEVFRKQYLKIEADYEVVKTKLEQFKNNSEKEISQIKFETEKRISDIKETTQFNTIETQKLIDRISKGVEKSKLEQQQSNSEKRISQIKIEAEKKISEIKENNRKNARKTQEHINSIKEDSKKKISEIHEKLDAKEYKIDFFNNLVYKLQEENYQISNQANRLTKWLSHYKVLVISILALSIIIIYTLFVEIKTAPFQMNVGLSIDKTIQVHSDYPELSKEARVLFYFPDEVKEKEVTFSNEMLLSEIPNKLNDTKCRVELKDPYWTLSKKNLLIQDNAVTLSIKPNEVLSKIKGEVNDIFGNSLNNVFIKMETLSTKTDERGYFSINIPVEERRTQYNIRIEKDGYISKKLEYTAGTNIEVRLNKNH